MKRLWWVTLFVMLVATPAFANTYISEDGEVVVIEDAVWEEFHTSMEEEWGMKFDLDCLKSSPRIVAFLVKSLEIVEKYGDNYTLLYINGFFEKELLEWLMEEPERFDETGLALHSCIIK